MASRTNPYARDPNIAKAFDNLAELFKPPSGTDAAGWAAAAAKKAEASRLQWLFDNSADPTAAARSSLLGIQSYGNTQPGFMQTDATTRRGQDITAATSAQNNVRDNQRQMVQTRYGDLSADSVRPAMPASVAGMYGLPEQAEQRGIVKLGQNQTAALPGGETLTGINRPQTMDEWNAQQAERMRTAGTVTDDMIADLTFGKQTPVVVAGPNGPAYAAPGRAAREGLPAAAAPSATPIRREAATAFIGDRQVPVTRDPSGLTWQMPDGSPVPDGARVTNMPTPQGGNDQLGLPTTANRTDATKAEGNVAAMEDMLNKYERLLKENPGVVGLPGTIRGLAQDVVSTVSEMSAAFGRTAPDAKLTLDQVQGLAERIAPHRDPAIQQARSLQVSLAYMDAQASNPSGEVSRRAFETSLEKITGGAFRNNQSALEAVTGMRSLIDSQRKKIGVLRGAQTPPGEPGPAAATQTPASPTGGSVERWMRGADGTLVRAP